MTTLNLRYFVARSGPAGPRHYWQPSAELRAAGWRAHTLSRNKATAWGEADAINANLDKWYELRLVRRPGADTVAGLIQAYKGSRLWRALAPKSRVDYEKHFTVIRQWFAGAPLSAITPGQVQRKYESLATTAPARSAAIVVMLRILFNFAINNDLARSNPAARPQITTPRATTPVIWPARAVTALIRAADDYGRPSIGDAIACGYWLGHYPGDLARLERRNYRDGVFSFTRAKTGASIHVPQNPLTAARIAGALARQTASGILQPALIVCETTGRPYASGEALVKVYRKVRARAAKNDGQCLQLGRLIFKWLRHTAVVRLAEAGCTTAEIASITGHSLAGAHRILDWYFDPTEPTARAATAKRLEYERENQ